MDLVYTSGWNDNPLHASLGHSGRICSSWSCTNLLAFTCEKRVKGFSERFLHILDPNLPWDIHSIACKTGPITSLQWNQTGTKLLCCDANGCCYVWTMGNHLTNSWSKKNNMGTKLHGEDILALSWLHLGRKVMFHMDKLDLANEKFTKANHKPSVTQMGGQPMEGYIAVTSCGRVVATVLTQDDEAVTAKGTLDISNNTVMADICLSSQGSIVIMAAHSDIDIPIQFRTIELNYDDDSGKLSMEINVLPSITLKSSPEPLTKYDHISHVRFVSRESPDHHVLVSVTGSTGSMIKSWLMKKEPQPHLHPTVQQLASSSPAEKLMRWNFVKSSQHFTKMLSFSIPPMSISTTSSSTKAIGENKFFCGIIVAVALEDNTIQILHRLTLNLLMHIQVPGTVTGQETKMGKRSRISEYNSSIKHIHFSSTSCALAVFDNHASLFMYRVAPWLNHKAILGGSLAVRHLTHLLHYCIITGYEWWDILLHMQPGIVRAVCDQLSNEFSKQPAPMQQMLQSRLQSVKITMFQTIGSPEAVDCHLRLLFEAITVVFRSLLRPPQDSLDEQAPADKLHEACSTSFETDITKLLQCVDTDTQTLQSLQQLIQWVADVTLYLLAIVPQLTVPKTPGVTLLRDKGWLSKLRELLVIIQTWGLLKSACSPIFCCLDEQRDCISHIFKLVTKVWQAISLDETRSHIPDDVVDECCLLPNQILIPSLDVITPVDGVLQRLNVIPTPYRFCYGKRPYGSVRANKFSNLDFVRPVDNVDKVDNLRRIFLGTYPVTSLKQCVRCGIVTVLNSNSNPNLGFWDQRFTRSCLCGGRWRKQDNKK